MRLQTFCNRCMITNCILFKMHRLKFETSFFVDCAVVKVQSHISIYLYIITVYLDTNQNKNKFGNIVLFFFLNFHFNIVIKLLEVTSFKFL